MSRQETSDAPKIGIVFRLDSYGGVESCVIALVRALNQRSIVPELIWDRPPQPAILSQVGIKVAYRHHQRVVASSIIDWLPNTLRYLPIAMNSIGTKKHSRIYDFIFSFVNWYLVDPRVPHTYYCSGPPLLPQLEPKLRGARAWFRDAQRAFYTRWLRPTLPAYEYHRSSKYFINSKFTARLFKDAHGADLQVLYPPIPMPSVQSTRGAERHGAVFFSRLVPYKRAELVLRLADSFPQTQFTLMGATTRKHRNYISHLRREVATRANCALIENPDYPTVAATFLKHRFFIFPAIDEHFGMVTAEAIAAGLIPFVHDSGGQIEIVRDASLRFRDSEMQKRFAALQALSPDVLNSMHAECATQLRNFDAVIFQQQMLAAMDSQLLDGLRC